MASRRIAQLATPSLSVPRSLSRIALVAPCHSFSTPWRVVASRSVVQLHQRSQSYAELLIGRATDEETSTTAPQYRIKRLESDEELLNFLQLALQGYFESSFGGMFQGEHSEYVNTFMRGKLEAEVEKLKVKYAPRGEKYPETMALIAVEDASEDVLAGCEVCICERLSGICPVGVPVDEKDGFYIQNLIVQPNLRRQGIGNQVMTSLLTLLQDWKATAVYAHVEAQNEEALAFYDKLDFQILKEVKDVDPQANLGRVFLLKLEISQ